MLQRVRLDLEGGIECNFASFTLILDTVDITQNSATFELPVHNYVATQMMRPELKKGLKAKVYLGDTLRLTGELENPKRKTGKDTASISLIVKSKGSKAKKTTSLVKDGDMLNANISDILKELAKNAGLEFESGEFEDEKIIRFNTTGFERLDRELHIFTRDRGIHLFEDAEGILRATQKEFEETGCDLIFGDHFQDCEVDNSDEKSSDKIMTIGTRNLSKDTDFEGSFTPPQEKGSKLNSEGLLLVYSEGDQTPKSLKDRAAYEVNSRAMADINVTIKIPSIVSPSGEAWGGRVKHHIKSPPHGVDDDMVIKKIELSGSKEIVEATLTFSPLTGMTNKDGKSGGGEANLNETTE